MPSSDCQEQVEVQAALRAVMERLEAQFESGFLGGPSRVVLRNTAFSPCTGINGHPHLLQENHVQ